MRKVSTLPPKFESTPPLPLLKWSLELISPMVGGGTKSYVINQSQPVRPSGIKNQLRFWWRAMQPSNCPDLLAQERRLFGSTKGASPVTIILSADRNQNVEPTSPDSDANWFGRESGGKRYLKAGPGHVLYPLQPAHNSNRPWHQVLRKYQFELELRTDARLAETDKEAIRQAALLWLAFGGVGGRTRRACGALALEKGQDGPIEFACEESFLNWFRGLTHGAASLASGTAAWPVTKGSKLLIKQTNANDPWEQLVTRFHTFRQGSQGRVPRTPRPSQSYWPEADSLRVLSGQAGKHTPSHPESTIGYFPRASLGLPIQFQFPNGEHPQADVSVKPSEYERWPSPLHLSLVRLNDGKVYETSLILNHACPELAFSKIEHETVVSRKSFPATAHPNTHAGRGLFVNRSTSAPTSSPGATALQQWSTMLTSQGFQTIP